MAPFMPVLVPLLRREGEIDVTDAQAELLCRISASTIDRMLKGHRQRINLRGRSRTKPDSLLKHQIPIRTRAHRDDAEPGFIVIDLQAHDGASASGEYRYTLTMTDIATGWTVNRSVPNPGPQVGRGGHRPCGGLLPLPNQGHRFRQRQRAHQPPPAGLLPAARDHLHPGPLGLG